MWKEPPRCAGRGLKSKMLENLEGIYHTMPEKPKSRTLWAKCFADGF
jgi:hypothetical protein